METALIVIGALIALVIVLVVKPKSAPPPQVVREVKPFKVSPPPFDPQTSQAVQEQKTIEGAAYVIDGDSIIINKTQVRLFGIDAPELDHPYGKKAKWALVNLCKGQKVRATIKHTDAHGRTVAHCALQDGRDLSAEMVKGGLAIDWPKYSNGKYRAFEVPDARKRMWLADARQKGRMHVWEQYAARQTAKSA